MFWCGSVWIHFFFLDAVCFLYLSVFFQACEDFSHKLKNFVYPSSVSFPSGTPVMGILVCLTLSWRYFKLSNLLGHFCILLYPLFCCQFLLVCFSFQLLYSSILTGCFLIFSNYFLKVSLCSSNLVSILITNALNSLSGELFLFHYAFRDFSVLSVVTSFLFYHFA